MNILVLFDIDGTILQMKGGISKEIFSNYLVKLFGQEITASHVPTFHGMTDMQIIKEIAENINYPFDEIEHKLVDIWEELSADFSLHCTKENIELMEGVDALLDLLEKDENVRLGLLTGNIKRNAYAKLDAYGLSHYFPVGSFGDDSYDRNELPAIAFRRANEHYKNSTFNANNSILAGDSPRDIECGKTNSIAIIAVATGGIDRSQLEKFHPDYIFNSFIDYKKVYSTIINHFYNEKNNNSG